MSEETKNEEVKEESKAIAGAEGDRLERAPP